MVLDKLVEHMLNLQMPDGETFSFNRFGYVAFLTLLDTCIISCLQCTAHNCIVSHYYYYYRCQDLSDAITNDNGQCAVNLLLYLHSCSNPLFCGRCSRLDQPPSDDGRVKVWLVKTSQSIYFKACHRYFG